jgi:hypothetical protein
MNREELQRYIADTVTASVAAVLTTHLEPIRDQMAALSGNTTASPRTRDAALQAAGRQHRDRLQRIDAEREKIRNSTWTHPEVELAEQNITIQLPTNHETTTDAGPAGRGFDAKKLPKYGFGKNLAEWIKLMDIIIMTYGETKVCPSVLMHCLAEGDVVRAWFVSLGNTDIEYMTTRPGCWEFMKSKFTEKWRASAGRLQLACDKRKKEYNESYTQYALWKLNMIEDAYPLGNEENKILQIRLGLDAPAARYCREWKNLQAFLEEIGHYDEQLDLEKMTNNNQGQHRGYGRQYDTARQTSGNPRQYPNRQTTEPYRTAYNTGASGGPGSSGAVAGSADKGKGADNSRERYRQGDRNREGQPTREMRGAELRATLRHRLNPANGKTEMSYTRRNGTPVFMMRPCNKCLRRGQDNQWHFDFDCREDPAMKAFVVNYANDIYGAGCYDIDTYHEIDHRLRSEAEGVYDSEEESGNDMGFEQM